MNLNYYGINFSTRSDAEDFLYQMLDDVKNYGTVTLADVLTMDGKRPDYADTRWYWNERDIRIAKIIRLEDCYTVELPDSKHFDSRQSSTKSTPEPLNICIHVNDLEDPDAVIADTFKYIYTIKDRMVNLTIL